MKRFFGALRRFFLPPADAKVFTRVLPLFVIAFVVILLFAFTNYAWEESNSPAFCGLTCHTMPPEYATYQHSAHTNIACEDCHMGRDRLPIMIQRKVAYSWQTGSAMVLNTYHYPIKAKNMAPAREACENCHKPDKFSADKLVELKHFAEDAANTPTSTFLVLHTGGGTKRQGLGYGIHWHVENPVYFYATDAEQQNIPYVAVTNPDGSKTEYVDVQSEFDPKSVKQNQLVEMDCITCHNRTAHSIQSPQDAVDDLMTRNLVSAQIPEIKKKATEALGASYPSDQAAMDGISTLVKYYQGNSKADPKDVQNAVQALQDTWKNTNFLDQKMNWQTHPNNLAHMDSPGCFRCHDGKHLAIADPTGAKPTTSADTAKSNSADPISTSTGNKGTIRMECNLCHSVPVVSTSNQLTANLQLNKGFEPPSHQSPNWIGLHNEVFDESCKGCHKVDDPGGVSNTSFCSNSVCHGATWKFAGFDAPKLRTVLIEEAKILKPTPTPTSEPGAEAPAVGSATWDNLSTVLNNKCGTCHGEAATKGLNILTYDSLMKGGEDGPVVTAGDSENSMIVKVQSEADAHFGQLSAEELALLKQWIQDGAKEK